MSDTPDDRPDPTARANPVARDAIDALPLHDARRELWEEIMASTEKEPAPRPPRRTTSTWFAPVAAAAAVVVVAGGIWAITRAGDDATGPDAAASSSAAPSTPAGSPSSTSPSPTESTTTNPAPTEHYMMPARPVILTAPGWKPDVVHDADVTWAGPGGARITLSWFFYAGNEDPFSLKKADRHPLDAGGTEITVLAERTRLTGYSAAGVRHHVALPEPVIDRDGTGLLIDGTGLSAADFQQVLGSAQWVDLQQYDKVVKPAVG